MKGTVSSGLQEPARGSLLPEAPADEAVTSQPALLPNVLRPYVFHGVDAVAISHFTTPPSAFVASGQEVDFAVPQRALYDLGNSEFTFVLRHPNPPAGSCFVSPPAGCGAISMIGTVECTIGGTIVEKTERFVHTFNIDQQRMSEEAKRTSGELKGGSARSNLKYNPAIVRGMLHILDDPMHRCESVVSEACPPYYCQLLDEVNVCNNSFFDEANRLPIHKACGNYLTMDMANLLLRPQGLNVRSTQEIQFSILFKEMFPLLTKALLKGYPGDVAPEMRIRISFSLDDNDTTIKAWSATPSMYVSEAQTFTYDVELTSNIVYRNHERNPFRNISTPILTQYHNLDRPRPDVIYKRDMTGLNVQNPLLTLTVLHAPPAAVEIVRQSFEDGSLVFSKPINTETILRVGLSEDGANQAVETQLLAADGYRLEALLMYRTTSAVWIENVCMGDIPGSLTRLGPFEICRAFQSLHLELNHIDYYASSRDLTYPLDAYKSTKDALQGNFTVNSSIFNSELAEGHSKYYADNDGESARNVSIPIPHPMFQPIIVNFPAPFNVSRVAMALTLTPPISRVQKTRPVTACFKFGMFDNTTARLIIRTSRPLHVSSSTVAIAN